jgi:hypothetical protein
MDLETREIKSLLRLESLFSPRYSPDGRHIAALSFDGLRLVLFDVARPDGTPLRGHDSLSRLVRDGRYVYFDTGSDVRRVRVADHRAEVVTTLKNVRRPTTQLGQWFFGLGPDDPTHGPSRRGHPRDLSPSTGTRPRTSPPARPANSSANRSTAAQSVYS